MIPSIALYLVAFGMAWASVLTHGFPWTLLFLSFPAIWVSGIIRGYPSLLTAGLYGLITIAAWAAFSEAFIPGLGAVLIALVAWDAAGLYLWLRKAAEVHNRGHIWRAALIRSCTLASIGGALAIAFAQLEISLPFWGMVVLLLLAWGILAALRRSTAGEPR